MTRRCILRGSCGPPSPLAVYARRLNLQRDLRDGVGMMPKVEVEVAEKTTELLTLMAELQGEAPAAFINHYASEAVETAIRADIEGNAGFGSL